jgi:hypothetical protein
VSDLVKRDAVLALIDQQRRALLTAAEGEAKHHADVLVDFARWFEELARAVMRLASSHD